MCGGDRVCVCGGGVRCVGDRERRNAIRMHVSRYTYTVVLSQYSCLRKDKYLTLPFDAQACAMADLSKPEKIKTYLHIFVFNKSVENASTCNIITTKTGFVAFD